MRSSIEELNNRRKQILTMLNDAKDNRLTVNNIAHGLDVSVMTVRRDLDELEELKLITRFHGGAELLNKETELKADQLIIKNLNSAISKKAAEYVTEDSTIFINSSSTALNTLTYLKETPINLFTNNLNIVTYETHPASNIIVTGGEIRPNRKNALVGNNALQSIQGIHSNITIIGCSGVGVKHGISTNNLHEANLNHLYLQNSDGLKVLVANHTKINKKTNFFVADIIDIDIFITDRYASNSDIREIESWGVTVIQV